MGREACREGERVTAALGAVVLALIVYAAIRHAAARADAQIDDALGDYLPNTSPAAQDAAAGVLPGRGERSPYQRPRPGHASLK